MTKAKAITKVKANMEANKQVATKQSNEVVKQNDLGEWGEEQFVSPQDLIVSKLLPMQGLSDKVMEGKAAFGEIRDSVTNECYASIQKPMEFIPFSYSPVWIEEEYNAQTKKYKYARTVPINHQNDGLPFESEGIKRTRQLNFFVLVVDEIKKGIPLPKLLSFKSTSIKAGRNLLTQMDQINRAINKGKPDPARVVMKLSVTSEKNDKGTYAVLNVEKVRDSTPEEKAQVFVWFDIFKKHKNDVKIDEAHEEPASTDNFDPKGEYDQELGSTGQF